MPDARRVFGGSSVGDPIRSHTSGFGTRLEHVAGFLIETMTGDPWVSEDPKRDIVPYGLAGC